MQVAGTAVSTYRYILRSRNLVCPQVESTMQVSSDRRDQLASIVDHLDVSIRVRDWQSARRQGLCAAVLAEELDDVDLMARLGDDLERLNEFAVAGRLMARAGRRISQIT